MFKKLDKLKNKVTEGINDKLGGEKEPKVTTIIQPADCTNLVGGFVIAFGDNHENQLAQTNPQSSYSNKNLVSIPSSFKPNIAYVTCGNDHCFFVAKDGKIYFTGSNKLGQFGSATSSRADQLTEYRHTVLKAKKVFCGEYNTAFISDKGQLYLTGKGELLGTLSTDTKMAPTLVPALSSYTIEDYATGPKHSYAVDKDGNIYGWGKSDNLGIGNFVKVKKITKILREPMLIESPAFVAHKVTSIACGDDHTLCLLNNGDVYAWGRGDEGQLGNQSKDLKVSPTLVESLQNYKVRQISCGAFNSSMVTVEDDCYIWGQYGEHIMTPQLLQVGYKESVKVKQIAQNSYYNIVLSTSNDIYTFGADYKIATKDSWTPTKLYINDPVLVGKKVTQVAASAANYYMIVYEGADLKYGTNIDYSKKGHKATAKDLPPMPQSTYAKNKAALFAKPSSTTTTTTTSTSSSKYDHDESVL
ncbi:hypothetical protein CYY_002948 [Polysphondylium violaceum]|uniref:Regulator of chromosome condensation domain-containing protein n=1 Tax=Polysphondylium violaceum TaxID=133409 RepID=A0A8J4UUQ4_9MYCE|nr:hypothetical protein CYY_002948 [Polysphondylium violaceum]